MAETTFWFYGIFHTLRCFILHRWHGAARRTWFAKMEWAISLA
jgi:hypothetical protein